MKENKNYMRDLMIATIEISRRSKVPMLYLGNPGVGKTTIVNMYAEYCYKQYKTPQQFHIEEISSKDLADKMHVESVIGSAFDRSEILGYMVNDSVKNPGFLTMKDPEWYHRILQYEEKGIPSFLFIDEIPTTPKDVQGSLYRLIFERVLNSGHTLPDDCIIVSAGNYKANLPVMCDITSPSLNRFCIINFQPRSFKELILEASQKKEDLTKDLPVFKTTEMTKEYCDKALEYSTNVLLSLEETYSGSDTSKGMMDCNNTNLADVYDGDYAEGKAVYNFISKRTIGYFHSCFAAMASMGIKDKDVIGQIVDGLIGLGFNSFAEIKELNAYRKFVKNQTIEALKAFEKGKIEKEKFSFTESTIAGKVEELSLVRDEITSSETADAVSEIIFEIVQRFPTSEEAGYDAIFKDLNNEKIAQMKADFTALEKFKLILNDLPKSKDRESTVSMLDLIIKKYKFYMLTAN